MSTEKHNRTSATVTTICILLVCVFPPLLMTDLPPQHGVGLALAFLLYGAMCAMSTALLLMVWREALANRKAH